LRAEWIGEIIANIEKGEGHVELSTRNTIICKTAEEKEIIIITKSKTKLPYGIGVDEIKQQPRYTSFKIEDRKLKINRYEVNLSNVPVYRCDIPRKKTENLDENKIKQLTNIALLLTPEGSISTNNLITNRVRWCLSKLEKGDGELGEALREILGLGNGLTPSCDDFIAGFLAYQFHTRKTVQKELLESAERLTNWISYKIIEHAAYGRIPEPHQKVITYLLQGVCECPTLVDMVSECIRLGHSSGYDMLVGILCAASLENYVLFREIYKTLLPI